MSVRAAQFTDIPRITDLLVDAHKRSRYNGTDCQVDIVHTKRLLMDAIQRHGGKGEGATYVLVSERDNIIEGIIIGVAARIQEFLNKLYVSDLVFYQSEKAIPADARRLLQGVVEWANGMTKVFEITIAATDVISDYDRVAKLFQRMGFTQSGVMYRMRADQ